MCNAWPCVIFTCLSLVTKVRRSPWTFSLKFWIILAYCYQALNIPAQELHFWAWLNVYIRKELVNLTVIKKITRDQELISVLTWTETFSKNLLNSHFKFPQYVTKHHDITWFSQLSCCSPFDNLPKILMLVFQGPVHTSNLSCTYQT